MAYAAIGLSIVGFAVGLTLRLRALLLFVGVVLVGSIVFSIGAGHGFLSTLLTVILAQTILQSSYFIGLAVRTYISSHRTRHVF
jgi:hypothetical protein